MIGTNARARDPYSQFADAPDAPTAAAAAPAADPWAEFADAPGSVTGGKPAPVAQQKFAQQNSIKASNLDALSQQVDRVQALYDKGLKGVGLGSLMEYLPTPQNEQFDAAGAGLGDQALAAFRVPGVGSQSDRELAAFIQANQPRHVDADAAIEEKLGNLRRRVDAARAGNGAAPWAWAGGDAPQKPQGIGGATLPLPPMIPGGTPPQGEVRFADEQAPTPQTGFRFTPEQLAQIKSAAQSGASAGDLQAMARQFGGAISPESAQQQVQFFSDPKHAGVAPSADYSQTDQAQLAEAKALAATLAQNGGKAGLLDLIAQGGSFGLTDEAAGIVNAGAKALGGDFSLAHNYEVGRDAHEINLDDARDRLGWGGTAAEFGGGLIGGVPGTARAFASGGGVLARLAEGAKSGAIGGGLAGFGYGRGTEGSLAGAAVGAGAGGVVGAALPAVGEVAADTVGRLRRFAGRDPSVVNDIVNGALDADGAAPSAVRQTLAGAHERGSPMAISDTGDNARGLLASVGRHPGASKRVVRDAIEARQMEQGDRIGAAATRDLGPAVNVREVSEQHIADAQAAAKPLYDEAYRTPVADTPELQALLATPAGRQALGRARTIAANERRSPSELGFAEDAAGNVVLNARPNAAIAEHLDARAALDEAQAAYRGARHEPAANMDQARAAVLSARDRLRAAETALDAAPDPSAPANVPAYTTQTLDYVKRGLDDQLEPLRNPVTNKLQLDEGGRAVAGVRGQLLSEIDRLNPTYAQARDAYAGPARLREALEKGQRAMSQPADDVERTIASLGSEEEREQFRIGYRASIGDVVDGRTDGADKVQALLGTPRKRDVMQRVYGADEGGASPAAAQPVGAIKPQREAVNVGQARQVARAELVGKPIRNEATGVEATVSSSTLGKMTSASAMKKSSNAADHLLAVANADHLFRSAELVSRNADPRGEPTLAISRWRARLATPEGDRSVKLTVKETTHPGSPNPLYTVETAEVEPGLLAPSEGGIERGPGQDRFPRQAGSDADVGASEAGGKSGRRPRDLGRFLDTLGDEREMGATYKAVASNSLTAERQLQDAATGDEGLLERTTGAIAKARGNPLALVSSAMEHVRGAGKFGAGQAGRDTREKVAELLTETDPEEVMQIMRGLRREKARQKVAAKSRTLVARNVGMQTGRVLGAGIGSKSRSKDRSAGLPERDASGRWVRGVVDGTPR